MRRFSASTCLPLMIAAILLSMAIPGEAYGLFRSWRGARYSPAYSTYYSPYTTSYYSPYTTSFYAPYTTSYAPAYTASYAPTYTASYSVGYGPATTTTYYAGSSVSDGACCPTEQRTYSVSAACCPSNACVACYAPCCPTDCPVPQDGDSDLEPTPDSAGSRGRNPTFIEEEDRGRNYDRDRADEGFRLRDSSNPGTDEDMQPEPMDRSYGSAGGRETLRFKPPQTIINRREPAPTPAEQSPVRTDKPADPSYPLLKLEEKITSRSLPERTRLVQRRSWNDSTVAKNVSREDRELNDGWVPVPAPAQLVQK